MWNLTVLEFVHYYMFYYQLLLAARKGILKITAGQDIASFSINTSRQKKMQWFISCPRKAKNAIKAEPFILLFMLCKNLQR